MNLKLDGSLVLLAPDPKYAGFAKLTTVTLSGNVATTSLDVFSNRQQYLCCTLARGVAAFANQDGTRLRIYDLESRTLIGSELSRGQYSTTVSSLCLDKT